MDMAWITYRHGSSNATYASTSWLPSWSWTSCPGPVDFKCHILAKSEAAAEVLEVLAQPENDSNPYGAVSKAQLIFRGWIRHARCYWRKRKPEDYDANFSLAHDGVQQQLELSFFPDSDETSTRSPGAAIDAAIFPLWRQLDEDGAEHSNALLLRALSATEAVYRRVGLLLGWTSGSTAAVPLSHWMKDGENTTITIV